jgi:hypothetical protein
VEKQRYNWNAVIATVALLTEEPSIGNEISGDGFCVKRTDTGFTIDVERCDGKNDIPVAGAPPETPSSSGAVETPETVPAAADDAPVPVETGQGTPETPAVATGQGTPETPAVPTGQ